MIQSQSQSHLNHRLIACLAANTMLCSAMPLHSLTESLNRQLCLATKGPAIGARYGLWLRTRGHGTPGQPLSQTDRGRQTGPDKGQPASRTHLMTNVSTQASEREPASINWQQPQTVQLFASSVTKPLGLNIRNLLPQTTNSSRDPRAVFPTIRQCTDTRISALRLGLSEQLHSRVQHRATDSKRRQGG